MLMVLGVILSSFIAIFIGWLILSFGDQSYLTHSHTQNLTALEVIDCNNQFNLVV